MPIVKEFKEFALKGSVIDLAIGIMIGTAFGAIVRSLVDDVIMPLMGLVLGENDLSQQYLVLRGAAPAGNQTLAQAREAGAIIITYGNFLNTIFTFLLIALSLFLIIRPINRLRRQKKEPPSPPTETDCPYCLKAVLVKATRCPHCTSHLPRSEPSPATKPT